MSKQNIFAFDHVPQIENLKKIVGSLEECRRLGFVCSDEQEIQYLTPGGMGFLLYVVAMNLTTLAEAFAAGRQAALEEIEYQNESKT